MQMAEFNAVCSYEIGDKINKVKAVNGQLFSVGVSTITDIACTHYVKSGKVVFTYELDNCGQYVTLVDLGRPEKKQ